MWKVTLSPFGYALRASRDSALRAAAVGIPIRRLQWIAFVLAGAVAGVAGALYAYAKGSVFPDVASIPTSVDGLIMVLLGGIEHAVGPIVGASILGVVIILLVVAFPDGVAGFAARHAPRLRAFFNRSSRQAELSASANRPS